MNLLTFGLLSIFFLKLETNEFKINYFDDHHNLYLDQLIISPSNNNHFTHQYSIIFPHWEWETRREFWLCSDGSSKIKYRYLVNQTTQEPQYLDCQQINHYQTITNRNFTRWQTTRDPPPELNQLAERIFQLIRQFNQDLQDQHTQMLISQVPTN